MEYPRPIDVEKLIEIVYRKRPIWDKKSGAHSNRYVVDKCWKDISMEMGQEEINLRKKWKYLRDNFALEYSKLLSANDNGVTQSKWYYYPMLLFMKNVITPRTFGNGNKINSTRQIVVPPSDGGGAGDDDRCEPDFSTAFSQECQEGDQDTSQDTLVDSPPFHIPDPDCVIKVEDEDWLVEENHEPDFSNNNDMRMTHSESAATLSLSATPSPETHPSAPAHAMRSHEIHPPTPTHAMPWHKTHQPTPAVSSHETRPPTPTPTRIMPSSHETHPSIMTSQAPRSATKRKNKPKGYYQYFYRNHGNGNDSMADKNNSNKNKSRRVSCQCEDNKDKKIDKSQNSENEDQDLMFFKTLIPHVRLIPPHIKLKFQSQIQAVVQEFAYDVNNKAGCEPKASSSTSGPSNHRQGYDRTNVASSCPSRSPSPSPTPLV